MKEVAMKRMTNHLAKWVSAIIRCESSSVDRLCKTLYSITAVNVIS
jgi:hypothetical protein